MESAYVRIAMSLFYIILAATRHNHTMPEDVSEDDWASIWVTAIKAIVLDPSIYLSPSPPLTTTKNNDIEKLWSRSADSVIKEKNSALTPSTDRNIIITTSEPRETMEGLETFWPSFRPSVRGIHIPLSFHLSGTYGGTSDIGAGVYTSSYISMASAAANHGKSVLAGTNYKSYGGYPGLRVYGGETKPAWSGWGNGRWGHYGKG